MKKYVSIDPCSIRFNSMDERSSERFPTVSFCFGFKPEVSNIEIMNIRNIANWKEHQSVDAMNSTFRKTTFDLNEVVTGLAYGTDGTFNTSLAIKVGVTNHRNAIVEIMEVYSEYGRCYSVYSNATVNTNTVLRFTFNNDR